MIKLFPSFKLRKSHLYGWFLSSSVKINSNFNSSKSTDTDPSWWRARIKGKEGLVPANFVTAGGQVGPNSSDNAFHDACKRGNLELLEECLMNKVPVNVPDKAGNTGLHW